MKKNGQIDQLSLFSLPTKTLVKEEAKNTQDLNVKEKKKIKEERKSSKIFQSSLGRWEADGEQS